MIEEISVLVTGMLTASTILYASVNVIGKYVDNILPKKYAFFIKKTSAIIGGIYICLYFKLDITIFIRPQYDAIGSVMSGLIISQGTGFVKDVFNQIGQNKKDGKDILMNLSIDEINELTTQVLVDKGVEFGTDLGGPQDVTNTEIN